MGPAVPGGDNAGVLRLPWQQSYPLLQKGNLGDSELPFDHELHPCVTLPDCVLFCSRVGELDSLNWTGCCG